MEETPDADSRSDRSTNSRARFTTPRNSDQLPRDRATRFYDRIRDTIQRYVDKKGAVLGKTADFLLLVPDVFILLWRLTTDSRVNGKNKVLLGSASRTTLPVRPHPRGVSRADRIPRRPRLRRLRAQQDPRQTSTPAILREHWSGSEDVLDTIQNVLNAADSLVGKDMVGKIKKMMG